MSCEEFGARLAAERSSRGLGSQKEFGALLGMWSSHLGQKRGPVPEETVCRWENGRRWPDKWHAFCICHMLGMTPVALSLETVLTSATLAVMRASAHTRGLGDTAPHVPTGGRSLEIAGGSTHLDWDRLGATMRSLRGVDRKVVDDQWTITRHYLADMSSVSARTLLDLMSAHLSRLRQLRAMTTNEQLRHELGVMTCQMSVAAGILLTGLTDYGLAMEAYRYSAELAAEMHEGWLRSTSLILQAQLYGGHIYPRLALSPSRMLNLMEEAEAGVDLGTRPEARVLLYATRSPLNALLDRETAAWHDVEVAHRAEAQVQRSEPYFAAPSAEYLLAHEAGVSMVLGGPGLAIDLYSQAIARTPERDRGQQAWFHWSLAAAYARAEAPDLAAAGTWKALQLATAAESPFIIQGVEAVAEALVSKHRDHPSVQAMQERLRMAM